jgi:hypothetical protein
MYWSVVDKLTKAVFPQPNKLIADKVAEMHGQCEVIEGWPAGFDFQYDALIDVYTHPETGVHILGEEMPEELL